MGRGRENFLSLLDDEKIGIFCAYDKDYHSFKAKIHYENIFSHLGVQGIKQCVFMDQIHSNKVKLYDQNLKNLCCDGLISKEKKIALCVLSADCLPLILYHEEGIIAALHSGRKGSFENILKVCLNKIISENPCLKLSQFHLFILPGICMKNYELSGEILEFAKRNFGSFIKGNNLDLKALVKFQAKNLGINHIQDCEICSFDNDSFFSYRRNQTSKRFASVVYLKG
ncbi:laccase domain-containing protein [Campylobacter sp. VicNov18]|uniref:polyphenol oxidase family protein n=1 Tax=Campylobacter bilis TaxID=2691918 RepID=UPI00130EF53E|nr:laccase domain-containing protein [Campylobacter bilis]MPV63160.1 laccase [Campylobacter hepaticus]MBM0636660.1 laccase [Campylobacter bilis]MCC8277504.1 laccase domain-containing protein [Campylobacter bilis]MCC8298709.1 laccase domain-containing protein [Campylobacter bilis]MCC8300413.1 laccase domain-containing protein [Campylobacter bilis]